MPTSIYSIFDFLLDNSNNFNELKDLSQTDIDYLKYLNSNVKTRELYNFVYHGLHHSQKVMLFAYLIGKQENFDARDMKILMDAAIYHDVGRQDENEDQIHGLASVQRFDKLLTEDFYKDPTNMKIIKAISEGHSRDDEFKRLTFDNYELDEDSYERYSKLYDTLKDADALDRARFPKLTEAFIKEEFLRSDYSKSLMNFAFKINRFYRNVIDKINYVTYKQQFFSEITTNACLHGIGWDFAKLESILEYGILSNYAAQEQEIPISRNFEGNNSNMWISVIDSTDVQKNGEAYTKFVEDNIVFYTFCGQYHEGIRNRAEAFSKGLPVKAGLYEDESFVFDKIPKENIYAFVLPKGSKDIPLKDLNYLSCSNNYNVINNMVNHYCDYIQTTCNIELDKTDVEKMVSELKEKEVSFGKLNVFEQKQGLQGFIDQTDKDVSVINDTIANWMSSSFKQYFNLDENQEPTVGMLVEDIVKRKGISYEVMQPEETIYKVDLQQKKK